MKHTKIISTVVLVSMFAACFAGCNGTSSGNQDDNTWYDNRTVSIETPDTDKLNGFDTYTAIAGDGTVGVVTFAIDEIPDDYDWSKSIEQFTHFSLDTYDSELNFVSSTDLKEQLSGMGISTSEVSLNGMKGTAEGFDVQISYSDPETYEFTNADLAVKTDGTIEDCKSFDDINTEDTYLYSQYIFDGTTIALFEHDEFINDENIAEPIIKIQNGNGEQIDSEFTKTEEFNGFNEMLYLGDGKALFSYYTVDGEDKYLVLNTTDGTWSDFTGNSEFIAGLDTYSLTYVDGYGYVKSGDDGYYFVNFETSELEKIFSWNSCNINRYSLVNSYSLMNCTEDKFLLYGYYDNTREFVLLTKADTNPNEGKTYLTACDINGNSYLFCEAVKNFNDTESDYYINIVDGYGLDYDEVNGESEEEYQLSELEQMSKACDQLLIDLKSKDAPDIVCGTMVYSVFDNDCFADVSSYIDKDKIFENIYNSSLSDGALYQVPVCFYIKGISTTTDATGGEIGFDFDTYRKFIEKECNGTDPMQMMRQLEFITLENNCHDLFSESYNNDAFRNLCEFCKDINDDLLYGTEDANYEEDTSSSSSSYSTLYSANQFLSDYIEKGPTTTIVGTPSEDARGPVVYVAESAAVTSSCSDPEAAARFINIMLSDDIQMATSKYFNGMPVSESVFTEIANNSLEELNNTELYNYETDETYKPELDESVITQLKDIIGTCEYISSSDPAISKILAEEIQPYFEGQKSIDEVITIIDDKVSTVKSERE